MSRRVVLVSGSPAVPSRSAAVLAQLGEQLHLRNFQSEHYSLDAFEPTDLLRGRIESESVSRFRTSIANAEGVVLATPVYKASYAGALKLMLDVLLPTALEGKVLLAITTARLEPHLAEVDESFQRLYRFFRGSVPQASLGLLDSQINTEPKLELDAAGRGAFTRALESFLAAFA